MVIKLSKNRIDLDGLPLMNADLQGCTVNGSALSSASGSAFDQVALANLRLLLQTSLSSCALVQGYQWEDTNAVPQGTGTGVAYSPNGNITNPAAFYDGVTSQTAAASTHCPQAAQWTAVGKDWGVGSSKIISGFTAYASSDQGFKWIVDPTDVTLSLQGSSDGSTWSTLFTSPAFTDSNALVKTYTQADGIPNTTAYRYHRVYMTSSDTAQNCIFSEVEFTEFGKSGSDFTYTPSPAVSVASAPSFMDAYFLYKDDSGTAVLGTDLTVELSRDGGTTWTTASLSNLCSYDGTYSFVKARADVSAQPSGTSMLVRISALNSKAQRVAAPALYAE